MMMTLLTHLVSNRGDLCFDLHLHTNLSDGELDRDALLERLRQAEITTFSITDHNHALAYENLDIEDMNYICGTEIATTFEGNIIEVLGYHIDPTVINAWYREFYSQKNLEDNESQLFNDLKVIARRLNYEVSDTLEMGSIVKGISKRCIYNNLVKTYPDFAFKTYKQFFRKGLSNPVSAWYLNEGRFYPSLDDTISLIHKAGGLAILAHPYEYGLVSLEPLFKDAIDRGLDGIECFHPSASMYQSVELAKYCCDQHLIGSGGSDFHRDSKGICLGVHAHKNILELTCFDWLKGA